MSNSSVDSGREWRTQMTDYIQVYTTLESKEDAKKISKGVVEKRLAACAQIMGPIESTYWWEGKIEASIEWLCVMKSRSELYEALEKTIKEIHPYDVPEILAVPVKLSDDDIFIAES
jgi:periplasmic divalent cation tolerance protein